MGSPEHAVAPPATEAFGEKRRRQWQQGEPETLGYRKRTAEQPELGGTQGSSSPALEREGLRGAGGIEQPGVSGAVGWWLLRELSCSGGTKLLSQHLVAARLSLCRACTLLLGGAGRVAPTKKTKGLGKCDLQSPFTVALLITGIWDVLQ